MQVKNSLHDLSPVMKSVFLLILLLFGFLGSMAVLYGLNEMFFGFPPNVIDLITSQSDKSWVNAVKIIQIASQFGMFIFPPLALGYLINTSVKDELGFNGKTNIAGVLLVVVVTLMCIPFINYLVQINTQMHLPEAFAGLEEWMRSAQTASDRMMEVLLRMDNVGDILLNVAMVAVIPAVGEELLFRGVLQKQLIKGMSNPHVAIILTAVIFSAFHMQFLGFFSRAILGALFGYLYFWSKNIWYPIIAHFTNNGFALGLAIVYGVDVQPENLSWKFGAVALIMAIAGLVILLRQRRFLIGG